MVYFFTEGDMHMTANFDEFREYNAWLQRGRRPDLHAEFQIRAFGTGGFHSVRNRVINNKGFGFRLDTRRTRCAQYRSATGYGCPDTAPCDSKYYGLRQSPLPSVPLKPNKAALCSASFLTSRLVCGA